MKGSGDLLGKQKKKTDQRVGSQVAFNFQQNRIKES